jgi:hypothetical protein
MTARSFSDLLLSSRQPLEERPPSVFVDSGSEEDDEPTAALELSEMRKVLNDFMADASRARTTDSDILKQMNEREPLRGPIPRPPPLQMSTRPQDLIEGLKDIYQKEQGVDRPAVAPPSTKRVLVIPMAAKQRQKLTYSPGSRARTGSRVD